MTISGSLSNALSGLRAAARSAEVVSANVANALTEGYGQRDISLTSTSLGGNGAGVSVTGISRSVDYRTISERRLAEASVGHDSQVANFFANLKDVIGTPNNPGSLTARLSAFEANLIEAASRPDSETRLTAVADSAKSLAEHFNSISDAIQSQRMYADQEIFRQTEKLNQGLEMISSLNQNIRQQIALGNDANALMDQRQNIVDDISSIVPVKEIRRDNGQIALFTTGGAVLLDGKPAKISFTSVGIIVPEMTLASGALSGLSINDQPIASAIRGALSGGSLAGLFSIRDEEATNAQAQLDAVARDLIERFSDPSIDPTLAPADPGLFTDAGGPLTITTEVGLAGRISFNALADPTLGGEIWKIRDGLGAITEGNSGNASTLNALVEALTTNRVPLSGNFIGTARSASGLAGDYLSMINTSLNSAEASRVFESARFNSLKSNELAGGVNTDEQIQQLLVIEQTYSANAHVIATIDEMIQTLLGL